MRKPKKRNRFAAIALGAITGLALGLAGCATPGAASSTTEAPPGFDPVGEQPWESFVPADEGELVWIGGQPTEEALRTFRAKGGKTVLNLKTREEMRPYPDYADRVESLGLAYVHVPTDKTRMGPQSAGAFELAMKEAQKRPGRVMVHCQASGRAVYAMAMNRVRTGTMTEGEATAWARWMRKGRGWEPGEAAIRAVARERAAMLAP